MNLIWGGMILIGIFYGILTGRVDAVSEAVLTSAKEAVGLCITMTGVMALWMGLMEIAEEGGLIRAVSRRIQPVIQFLFPDIPKGHPACEPITLNLVANLLGLGWAATPAGLQAMEALASLEEERRTGEGRTTQKAADAGKGKRFAAAMPRGTASNEMCTFLILNISSIQLIPVNVIAYRSQYGSVNPTAIVGPGIAATVISTAAAVLFCKIMDRR